jgi:hypothetical protein
MVEKQEKNYIASEQCGRHDNESNKGNLNGCGSGLTQKNNTTTSQ